jgi:RNA polymerase sigma factor (sigma-70 family)
VTEPNVRPISSVDDDERPNSRGEATAREVGPLGVDRTERLPDFAEFFGFEYPRLLRAMVLLTGSRVEAEDLVQEALARTFERWERVRTMESPAGYAYQAAVNLNRSRLRRLRVRARLGTPTAVEPDATSDSEARDEVLAILASLSREQREALVLVEWLGFSTEEAGGLLGIDSASVRGRLHRARVAIRKQRWGRDE